MPFRPWLSIAACAWHVAAFAPMQRPGFSSLPRHFPRSRDAKAVDPASAVTLGAGMIGGSVGVGVAYPLDTLKTKQQAYAGTDAASSTLTLVRHVFRNEGFAGFYSGVTSTMAGQALIKGVVFFAYDAAKDLFAGFGIPTALTFLLAACASGAIVSLVVTPIERIKVVMQASDVGAYAGPLACTARLIRADGLTGLMFRGLGATLLREIPSYGFYFISYDLVKAALLSIAGIPPPLTPLLAGAVAGAMSWIPIYPVDVVKTNIQVADGSDSDGGGTFMSTAVQLWQVGGFGIFWEGLGPKLARAVLNHAVTFYVYESILALPIFAQA